MLLGLQLKVAKHFPYLKMDDNTTLRLVSFFAVLTAMTVLERLMPKRDATEDRRGRWLTNISMVVLSTLLVKLVMQFGLVAIANIAFFSGWGVLNWFTLPTIANVIIAIIVFDFMIYLQHVASHRFRLLWRFHRVHHADPVIDTSTGLRFHPIEILLSTFYKAAIIVVIGAPAIAVITYEIILVSCALFNHANLRLADRVDKMVRRFFVTPDMHRIHHSVIGHETNSNYGVSLSWWDRIFSTYTDQPQHGQQNMETGLSDYGQRNPVKLGWSLKLPFASS